MFLQKLIEFFSTREAQLSLILSMLIQIFLVFFGSRRKISKAIWLKVLVWCAYISADAVAIFSLGVLVQNRGELRKQEPLRNHQLRLLWVSFLILHLGGPDTITAYSLEDNNLWLRHLLNLVIQVVVAFYAILKSWNNHTHNPLTYLVIPIFVWAVVRYCERIWTLKSATLEQINDRFSSECKDPVLDPTATVNIFHKLTETYQLMSTLTYSFAQKLRPTNRDFLDPSMVVFELTSSAAFKLVEDELGLMYDLLYTKVLSIHSRVGICLRGVYLVSSIVTLTSFAIMHKLNEAKWSNYPFSDILITYSLMIGAVILEIYTVIWIVLSDWALVWLGRCQRLKTLAKPLFPIICTCRRVLFGEKRWSRRLKQHNIVISSCTQLGKRRDIFPISLLPSGWKKELFDTYSVEVEGDDAEFMKQLVFQAMVEWRRCPYRFLEERDCFEFMKLIFDLPDDTMKDVIQFDTSIFAWYVATDLCYYSDKEQLDVTDTDVRSYYKASRYLSDYFMYLVCSREDMLPLGNYKQTYAPLVKFMGRFFDGFDGKSFVDACEKIIVEANRSSYPGLPPEESDVIQLVMVTTSEYLTHSLKIRYNPSLEERWKTISNAWAHLLLYAAADQHKWVEHAQQLRRGGEFLTHVAVLMAHSCSK